MDPIRVMVAEDEKYIRDFFIKLIDAEPDMSMVCAVSSGQKMVEAMDDIDVDVILSDVEMSSKTDGILCAKQILMFYPHVRIIFISAHSDDDTIFSAFEANAVDYLLKTSSPEEITSSIRKAYQNCSPISPYVADKLRNEFTRLKKNEQSLLYFLNIIFMLTVSERNIIKLLLDAKRPKEIAAIRGVEITTIKTQITTLLKKFNVKRTKDIVSLIQHLQIEQMFSMLPLE